MLDCSIHLSSVFLFFQSLALVILLLSLTEGNIHLGSTVIIDKYEGWNNGETRLLAVLFKTAQFALGEKKLAVAASLMIEAFPPRIDLISVPVSTMPAV